MRADSALFLILDLRQKFKDTVKHNSPEPRLCHIYPTSVIVESNVSLLPSLTLIYVSWPPRIFCIAFQTLLSGMISVIPL